MTPSWDTGGTTGLPGASPAYQGHHRPSKSSTDLPGAPEAYQGHIGPVRSTTDLSGAPQAFQGHHRPSRDTFSLSGAPVPVGDTSGLLGAPQSCRDQGHHKPVRGTTGPQALFIFFNIKNKKLKKGTTKIKWTKSVEFLILGIGGGTTSIPDPPLGVFLDPPLSIAGL